jgi:DNA-binding NarL/FixJ family response regulator
MRVALIAPSYALRLGLKALMAETAGLPGTPSHVEIVQEASSLDQLVGFLEQVQVQVLVIAGEAASTPALRQAAQARPGGISLLLLSDDPQAAGQLPFLGLRAWGVLPSDSSPAEIQSALQAVFEGLLVGTPELLLPAFSNRSVGEQAVEATVEQLTGREQQVLQLLARGLANKQIALQLGISEHTVKFHVSSIYARLGVTSRIEAVRLGVQQGLVVL